MRRHAEALDQLREARAIFREIDDRPGEALALDGLGYAHLRPGADGTAREHWQRAVAGYAELGVPEADEIRAVLDRLGPRVIR